MESTKRKLLPNPRQTSNFFSVLFFTWTIPIYRKSFRKELTIDDVHEPLYKDQSDRLGDQLNRMWQIEYRKKKPSLLRAVVKTFWLEILILGLLCFMNDVVIRLILPFLLENLLEYFKHGSIMSKEAALNYGHSIIFITILSGTGLIHYYFDGFHYGMKVRVAVCSVIYRKALRLSQKSLIETSPGKIVNLLSNDVSRFEYISLVVHPLWTSPLFTIAATYILWLETRWAGMIGLAVISLIVLIQSYVGKLSAIFRFQTALRADERIRFMDEIISGVQVIKIYAWEIPFAKSIALSRSSELKAVLKNAYVRAIYMTFNLFTTRMALFATVLSVVLMYGNEHITVAKVFKVSYIFTTVSMAMSQSFVRGFAEMAETSVAFKRLQMFLEYEEKDDRNESEIVNADQLETRNVSVLMKNVSATWKSPDNVINKKKINKKVGSYKTTIPLNGIDSRPITLQNIDMEIPKGKLIGIIGTVGAGKSSLIQVILHELPLKSGSIGINGSLSYAAQEPWVFAATARQNITFGTDMDRLRYDKVVKSTALQKDFEQFPDGDLIMIGERGVSLSGGQKARVNLARAVYRKANIYLLDDPLSAVDAHVGLHLYNECIGPKGFLAHENATRILVTHQVHFLKDADWIIVLRNGSIETQGTYNDIQQSGVDFAKILTKADEVNVDVDDLKRKGSAGVISTHSTATSRSRTGSTSTIESTNHSTKNEVVEKAEEESNLLQEIEETSAGKVEGSLLWNYLSSAQRPLLLVFLIVAFLCAQILASSADIWVSYWTRKEETRTNHNSTLNDDGINSSEWSTITYIYIYSGIITALFVIAFTRSFTFFHFSVSASQKLHDKMFQGLISTTMRFFESNPSGRILNRFTKDIGTIDEALPKVFLDAVQINLMMLGAILVTVYTNVKLSVLLLMMFVLFVFIRKVYLKCSTDLKRLDGMTKSPIFTHISATLCGLSTVRAFNAEKILQNEFDSHQDLNTGNWYTFVSISSLFGVSLDFMVYIFLASVIYFSLLFETGMTGDRIGLAITQTLTLTGLLQWGIRQTAEVSNYLTSVERILEYSQLEPEKQPEVICNVNKGWPSKGSIKFNNVIYRYSIESEAVLHGLTFSIKPKEKIGIVGRTGAGKSSLIGSIFRLALVEGDIFIDDVNLASVETKILRSKISIIPQDPVLFSGTLRRNLDPFEEYSDDDIWKSLENVQLKEVVSSSGGLNMPVTAHGSNFSVGQRQLLCLARAILRKNHILILDEATANVDPQTDQLIQKTIREAFADCTVLTVAHRLHTIIDSDRVLVMDAGTVSEFDKPYRLLQIDNGIFRGMVEALGPKELDRLQSVAKEKFENDKNIL